MENILLPTNLFIRMQDWELDTYAQNLFLALIINRHVNMTGVYVITQREMQHQISSQDSDGRKLRDLLTVLCEKKLVYYDDNVIFIPLIPETSRYAKHVFRRRMQRQVERLSKDRHTNLAIRAFEVWCEQNISDEKPTGDSEITGEADLAKTQKTTDKNEVTVRPMTMAEKHANMAQNGTFQRQNTPDIYLNPTDKMQERLPGGSGEAPRSLLGAPSSSSSLSSSYYSRRSTGIDVRGGAGEKSALARSRLDEFTGEGLGQAHRNWDENDNGDNEEVDYG